MSIYLHQGGHGGNPPADMVNRWFSHYLYGVQNGVEKDPPVWIVQDARAVPPAVAAAKRMRIDRGAIRRRRRPVTRRMDAGAAVGAAAWRGGRGRSGRRRCCRRRLHRSRCRARCRWCCIRRQAERPSDSLRCRGGIGNEKLIDDVVDERQRQRSGRAIDASPALCHRRRSPTPCTSPARRAVTLRIASSKPAANLSVWLVMLPYDSASGGSSSHAGVITRGWADIRNYKSLTKGGNYESTTPGEALVPGKFYDLTFDLEPDDEFVPAGKRLAVMIMSSDREFTLWPEGGNGADDRPGAFVVRDSDRGRHQCVDEGAWDVVAVGGCRRRENGWGLGARGCSVSRPSLRGGRHPARSPQLFSRPPPAHPVLSSSTAASTASCVPTSTSMSPASSRSVLLGAGIARSPRVTPSMLAPVRPRTPSSASVRPAA